MATRFSERSFSHYHAEDLDEILDDIKADIEDDLEFDSLRFRFNRVEPLSEQDCDERNRIDFDGDPILSPAWSRAIIYDVEETV